MDVLGHSPSDHTIAGLVPARQLMCSKLGRQMVAEQVVAPFGYVMVPRDDWRGAVAQRDELLGMLKQVVGVALFDGYGDEVAERAEALIDRLGGQCTDEQLDGLACIDCGKRGGAMVPAGDGPRGQLFRHPTHEGR